MDRAEAADPESARRKFERDKDELRALGIEIETVELSHVEGDEASTGYRLRAQGFYLPYFEMVAGRPDRVDQPDRPDRPYSNLARIPISPSEVRLLDRATRRLAERTEYPLSRAAASARRKLAFDLPLSETVVERVLAIRLPEAARQALAVLQAAVATHTAVACRYYSIGRDKEEDREIEPYGLFFQWSHWYCVGRARDRGALRVFRVDRVRDIRPLHGAHARFEVPETFDVRAYLGRAPWELSQKRPTRVQVRFGFPESRWVQNEGVARLVEPVLDDGGAILEFAVRERAPFLRWLLTFREQVSVVKPKTVARQLEQLRTSVAAMYE